MAQIRPGQLQENVLYNISASYAISASHEIVKEVSSSYADFAESASYAVTASYLDNYVEPFPFIGDAVITGSLTLSGSGSPLLSLPNAPQDAAIISGSSGTTSVYIYDSVDGIRTPTYDKGAGLRLVSGEGTGQATLDVSAVGSDNGGSNNEQTFIRSNQMLSLYGEGNAAGDNIRFRGSSGYVALDSTTDGTSLTFVTDGGTTPSTIALGSFAGSAGVQITAPANNAYLRFIQGSNTWLDLTSTKATFLADVSSSAASTASFGHYIGNGSEITGVISSSYALTASYAENAGGGSGFPFSGSAIITGSLQISSSTNQQLTLIGSGSDQPIFRVQGSAGELFSITDNLSGSLFAVNNISGLPILEVFSDDRIIQGDYASPMLTTTVKNTVSSAGAFTVYELPTASYDGAFFEYTARSGSNARAGQIMSIWSGSQVNFTETTTTDFGSTTGLAFTMIVTGSNFALTGSVTTADWTIKTIVRSI